MACVRVPFDALAWQQSETHPLEQKKTGDAARMAMLTFAPGFADPNWCERSHAIYVVSGELELELDGRVERVASGEGCMLDAGTRHKARNVGTVDAVLFIVSDLDRPSSERASE
jgi:quercetin dioxygenase-like cupin family protein